MLHIVNKSPSHGNGFASCLRAALDGHAVVLIEDAVYAATSGIAADCGLKEATKRLKVYALQPDLEARGMAARRIDAVEPIDYGGLVDLVTQYPTNQSWL